MIYQILSCIFSCFDHIFRVQELFVEGLVFGRGLHLLLKALLFQLLQTAAHFLEFKVSSGYRVRVTLLWGVGYDCNAMTQTRLQHQFTIK